MCHKLCGSFSARMLFLVGSVVVGRMCLCSDAAFDDVNCASCLKASAEMLGLAFQNSAPHGANVKAVAWCCPAKDGHKSVPCALAIGGDPSPTDAATVRVYIINKKTGNFDNLLNINTKNPVNAIDWYYDGGTTYYLAIAGNNLTDPLAQKTGDVLVYVFEGANGKATLTCVASYTNQAPVYAVAWLCKPCGMYEPNIADRAYLAIGGGAGPDRATARILTFAGPRSCTPCTFVDPTYSLQTPVTIVSLSWCCRPDHEPLLALGGTPCDPLNPDCSNTECCSYAACQQNLTCLCQQSDYCSSNSTVCCAPGGPGGPCCSSRVDNLCTLAVYCQAHVGTCCMAGVPGSPCCTCRPTTAQCQTYGWCISDPLCSGVCCAPGGAGVGNEDCCPLLKCGASCPNPVIFVYRFGMTQTQLKEPVLVAQQCFAYGLINTLAWCCSDGLCSRLPLLAIGCRPFSAVGKNIVVYAISKNTIKESAHATMADNGLASINALAWYPCCPCTYLAAVGTLDTTQTSSANVIIYERVPHEQELKAIAGANLDTAVNTVAWCPCSDGCVYLAAGSASTGGTNADVAVWRTSPLPCDYGVASHE